MLKKKEVSIAKHHLQEAEFQQDTSYLGIHAAEQAVENPKQRRTLLQGATPQTSAQIDQNHPSVLQRVLVWEV